MTNASPLPQAPARRLRILFAALATLSLVAVVYLSAIPLHYEPATLNETWERFWKIPWLNLSLERRADWVANGLVFIPFGFFFAGALHYRRGSFSQRQASLIVFALLQGFIVAVIEAMQVWFPPRVLSLNDMLAGYLGGFAGLFLWHGFGHRFVEFANRLLETPRGLPRLYVATWAGLFMLLAYSLLPLDIMVTPAEWYAKYRSDRFLFVPFQEWTSLAAAARELVLNAWALPMAIIFAVSLDKRIDALRQSILWCIAIEFASIPLYSVLTSITDILVRIVYAAIGVMVARRVTRALVALDRSAVWFTAALVWALLLIAAFLLRGETLLTEPSLISERLQGIFTVPFARAQKASEMVAAQNLLGKTLLFTGVGFLLHGWVDRCAPKHRRKAGAIAITLAAGLAVGIEVGQAFVPPLIADITDILVYSLGLAVGDSLFRILVPSHRALSQNSAPDFRQHPGGC